MAAVNTHMFAEGDRVRLDVSARHPLYNKLGIIRSFWVYEGRTRADVVFQKNPELSVDCVIEDLRCY